MDLVECLFAAQPASLYNFIYIYIYIYTYLHNSHMWHYTPHRHTSPTPWKDQLTKFALSSCSRFLGNKHRNPHCGANYYTIYAVRITGNPHGLRRCAGKQNLRKRSCKYVFCFKMFFFGGLHLSLLINTTKSKLKHRHAQMDA